MFHGNVTLLVKSKIIMNWTEYFLNIAEQVKLKSKDNSTQIGAVIVGEDN